MSSLLEKFSLQFAASEVQSQYQCPSCYAGALSLLFVEVARFGSDLIESGPLVILSWASWELL